MTQETIPGPSFGDRMRSAIAAFFRGLIRLVAILVVLAAIAFLIYLLPRLNLITADNTQQEQVRLQELDAQQTASSEQVDRLRERVHALELRSDTDKQALDEINAELENAAKAQQDQLDALTSTQTSAIEQLEQINAALEDLDQKINRLVNMLNQTSINLENLDTQVADLNSQLTASESPLAAFQRELVLIKAMEMLTRSRVYLVQNNVGLAKDEVQAARDLLAGLAVPEYQQATLEAMLTRLDLALASLPDSPILAAEDLEVAWQLLRAGLPQPASITATAEYSTLTEETTATPTPSPQATSEVTPTDTPEATPTPSPTP